VKARSGKKLELHHCSNCSFDFFIHDPSEALSKNKLDVSRLKSVGLDVPTIKLDFHNGTQQSKLLVQEYLDHSDKGSNMLEIGCSIGYFLKLMKDFGCKPYGVEINASRSNYVNTILNIPCFTELTQIEERGIKFKKIFLFYILEYVPNPVAYLARLIDLLEVGGSLICVTPNAADTLIDIWNNKGFRGFFYDEYSVNYMTLQSIEIILSKLNYTKANVMTRQGYSFASHLNWYFTEKPRTTGIVGGDNFVFDITEELNKSVINKNLPSNRRSAAQKISELFKEFDSNYRAVLEEESCGNQICFEITC
jgi:SAM-dependent methyltransferase